MIDWASLEGEVEISLLYLVKDASPSYGHRNLLMEKEAICRMYI